MKSPRELLEQRSVFVSYSRKDAAFAAQVYAALKAQSIHAWVDRKEIQSANPDWEDALRNAIRQSQAIILIASPNSRQSRHVKDELVLAHTYQLPVYPLWVLGDEWIDAIPIGWGRFLYILMGINPLLHTRLNRLGVRQSYSDSVKHIDATRKFGSARSSGAKWPIDQPGEDQIRDLVTNPAGVWAERGEQQKGVCG